MTTGQMPTGTALLIVKVLLADSKPWLTPHTVTAKVDAKPEPVTVTVCPVPELSVVGETDAIAWPDEAPTMNEPVEAG